VRRRGEEEREQDEHSEVEKVERER